MKGDYFARENPNLNNPNTLYARWGEPWLFGFPNDGAAAYVRHEGLDVLSDTLSTENICIAQVGN